MLRFAHRPQVFAAGNTIRKRMEPRGGTDTYAIIHALCSSDNSPTNDPTIFVGNRATIQQAALAPCMASSGQGRVTMKLAPSPRELSTHKLEIRSVSFGYETAQFFRFLDW